jgi:hypothetical protein
MLNENQLFSNPRLVFATALKVFLCMMEAKEYRGPASLGLRLEKWNASVQLQHTVSSAQVRFTHNRITRRSVIGIATLYCEKPKYVLPQSVAPSNHMATRGAMLWSPWGGVAHPMVANKAST